MFKTLIFLTILIAVALSCDVPPGMTNHVTDCNDADYDLQLKFYTSDNIKVGCDSCMIIPDGETFNLLLVISSKYGSYNYIADRVEKRINYGNWVSEPTNIFPILVSPGVPFCQSGSDTGGSQNPDHYGKFEEKHYFEDGSCWRFCVIYTPETTTDPTSEESSSSSSSESEDSNDSN